MTKRVDEITGTPTVGHEWDGIEELDTPMPRWWLWTFYLTMAFSLGYVIAYPAIPLLHRATSGVLGWSSRGDLAKEMSLADQARTTVAERLAAIDIGKLPGNPNLMRQAVAGGRAAFKVNCVQCHGAGAAGSAGFPNLNDDDWLWGGDLKAIHTTLEHGIRQPGDSATRTSQMPAFAGILQPQQISAVADHVLSLSGKGSGNLEGSKIFSENCAICHGPEGRGGRQFGAPNLADAIWLYGGTKADLIQQITEPRHGVMPAWQGRLDPVTIKMLAAYIHSLGGGEEASQPAPQPGVEGNGKS